MYGDGMMTINYSDIFFGFEFAEGRECAHLCKDHLLVYVYEGELTLIDGKDEEKVSKGQCVFLQRNHQICMKDTTSQGKVDALFLVFSRQYLREYYRQMDKEALVKEVKDCGHRILRLPPTPDITGLFLSMRPYLHSTRKPSQTMVELKRNEALQAILDIVPESPATLFDFIDPWKIDLKDFMEENYLEEMSIEELALYSGRSLSTFKRDFKKISELTPERWIMQRRLKDAQKFLLKGKKPQEFYIELGFKSLSNFSNAYKKQFGHAPTKEMETKKG